MKISSNYQMRQIAGEHIIVPTGEAAVEFNGLITVNEIGAFLWKILQGEATEEELLKAVLEEYDIDKNTAWTDIRAFLQTLEENEILRR